MKNLILIVFLLPVFPVLGQMPDATIITQEFSEALLENLDAERSLPLLTSEDEVQFELAINYFTVMDPTTDPIDLKQDYMDFTEIMNTYFLPSGIQFRVNKVEYVNEYQYGTIKDTSETLEMRMKYVQKNTINVFVMDTIRLQDADFFGYSYYPPDSVNNNVYIVKDQFSPGDLATLLGHFFGLLLTHEASFDAELVDSSNCKVAGDFICDTWADPNLLGQVSEDCLYQGYDYDYNNEYYVPTVSNIMSHSPGHCKCLFTPEQHRRMRYYYLKYKQYLN